MGLVFLGRHKRGAKEENGSIRFRAGDQIIVAQNRFCRGYSSTENQHNDSRRGWSTKVPGEGFPGSGDNPCLLTNSVFRSVVHPWANSSWQSLKQSRKAY